MHSIRSITVDFDDSFGKDLRRIREVNPQLGKTILGGGRVGGHDASSFQLPPAEMSAAINVQNITSDRRGVGQVHDRICDVLDR